MKKRSLEDFLKVFKSLTIANIQFQSNSNITGYHTYYDLENYKNEIKELSDIMNKFITSNRFSEETKHFDVFLGKIITLINLNLEIIKGNVDLVFVIF